MPRERNTDYQKISKDIADKYKKNLNLYIIAAEGDKTERLYFQALEKEYKDTWEKTNLQLHYIDRIDPNKSSPKQVKETLEEFLQTLRIEYDLQKNDELWMIIDTDDHNKRKQIILDLSEECEKKQNYYLGLSNPCFEFWLILHYVDVEEIVKDCAIGYDSESSSIKNYIEQANIRQRPKICKNLLSSIHQNKHEPYYEKLIEYIPQAIPRAKALGGCNPKDNDYPQKIGTELYKLMEKLLA